jgi:hypothetical protein
MTHLNMNAQPAVQQQASNGSTGLKPLNALDERSMVTRNPAPNASPPSAPTDHYRIVRS